MKYIKILLHMKSHKFAYVQLITVEQSYYGPLICVKEYFSEAWERNLEWWVREIQHLRVHS